ncbi:hypothetical protein [Bacillus altitudinis]|nr:hypothetical protein [Bacillus altitudinis]
MDRIVNGFGYLMDGLERSLYMFVVGIILGFMMGLIVGVLGV